MKCSSNTSLEGAPGRDRQEAGTLREMAAGEESCWGAQGEKGQASGTSPVPSRGTHRESPSKRLCNIALY